MIRTNNNIIQALLVEDNKEQARIIQLILTNNHCIVKIVTTGQEALDYLLSATPVPELVFLNYYLPDMTGLEIIKQINHHKIITGIVFISANNNSEDALEAIRLGAIDFITKSEQLAENLPFTIQKAHIVFNDRRKKIELENQVIEKEEIFFKTISLAPWGMHFYKLNHADQLIFIGANPAADAILGIKHINLIDKSIEEAFPTLTETEVPEKYKTIARNGGLWQSEQISYKDENIEGVFEVTAYQPSAFQAVAIFRDITEKYKQERQILIKNAEIELQNKEIQNQFEEHVQLIEELRQTNEELKDSRGKIQESQQNYQEIFDSTSDALIIHNSSTGEIVDLNNTTLFMFGYNNKQEIMDGSVNILSANGIGYYEEQSLVDSLKTNKSKTNTFEWLARKKKGTLFWVEISIKRSKIRGIDRLLASIRDISEWKQANNLFMRQLKFTDALLKALPIPVFYKDKNGNYIGCNTKFTEIMGVSDEEIKGKTVMDLWPGEFAQVYHEKDLQLISQPKHQVYEFKIKDKEKQVRDVIYAKDVFFDENNQVAGIVGTFMDITEQKQHELQLRIKNEKIETISQEIKAQNEEMHTKNEELSENLKRISLLHKIIKDREKILQSIINTANIGIAIINKEGRFILFNKYWYEKLGYTSAEMYHVKNLTITHPDDIEKTKDIMKSLVQGTKNSIYFEKRLLKKDGSFFWAELTVSSIKDDEGNHEMIVGVMKDISQRKVNEDLLKKNELQFRSIWTNSFDGMRLTDENGICVLVNDAFCRMVGMSKLLLEGYEYSIIYNDPNQEKLLNSFTNRFRKKEFEYHFERKVELKNHKIKWFEISNAFILEETNNPLLLSIFRDRTEEHTAKEAIIEKQRQISTLISNLPGIAYRRQNDHDWTMEFIGGECKELTGYEADEFISNKKLSFNEIISARYRKQIRIKWQQHLLEKSLFEYEYPITTASGEVKWVWERGRGIFSEQGTVIALEGFITDVTERIKTTKKLLEAESKYRSIFESAHEGIFQSTIEGRFITVNPAFAKIFGYNEMEDLLNSKYNITDKLYLYPEKRKEFLYTIDKQGFIKGFEFQARRKDGTIIWLYEDVRAVKDNKDRIIYLEGFCIDITKQKNSEELLIQKEIAENTAKFKQHFLANMSHEMRTPMNGIIGMVGFLMKTKLDETQLAYATTIQESSDNLLNIINNTLDLSRLEAGKIILHPKTVSIHDISRKTRHLFNALVKQKDIKLIINYSNPINEFIKVDELRVNQIISNFISNSIKFTEKGSITINYKQSKLNNRIIMKIEIIDTGIGISKENQKQLFKKFSQIDSSKTRHFEGAGLGLSICKELAVMMGGNVGLSSKYGKGSKFWFSFMAEPVTEKEIEQFNKSTIILDNCAFGLNILIVEDKAINSKILGMMLKNMGCTFEIASNGKEALKMYKPKKFDMILMDIQMPIMDGLTAAVTLKKKYKITPPIIALTADAMEGDAEYYISQGMDDYLSKPVLVESLYHKIQKWSVIINKI